MDNSFYLLDAFESMGTVWYIEIDVDALLEHRARIKGEVVTFLEGFSKKYSRFSPDSLVSVLNKDRVVDADEDLVAMLTYGEKISSLTEGVFSLYKGRAIADKGYGSQVGKSEEEEVGSAFFVHGGVLSLSGNQYVDLGGIGKGYAIDCISALLRREGCKTFIINGGGDMYVACDPDKKITIYLQNPLNTTEVIGSVALCNESLCASSSYVRMWKKEGEYKNHFVTKNGNEVWAASFVVGRDACTADVLATVCCLFSDDIDRLQEIAKLSKVTYLVIDEGLVSKGDLDFTELH
jgi:thiamine biosynthesis lipoprotein